MRFLKPRDRRGRAVGSEHHDAFRAVFENAADALLLADDQRRYVDANPAACTLLCLDRSEIVGRRIDEFTPATTPAQLADGWASFVETAKAAAVVGVTAERGARQAELDAVAEVPAGSHLSILRDVTDRKRAEDERRLFVDIVDALQVGLHVWQLDGANDDPGDMRLVYANPATMTVSGIPPDTIIGRTLREILPRFMATEIPAIYADVALGGTARSLGDVVYGADHVKESVFAARLLPLPGRRVGVVLSDVTTERLSEVRALATLESMTEAFYTLGHDWRFTYLNLQSEPLLQRKREQLIGKSVWEEFPEAVETAFYHQFQRAAREQVAVEFEEYYPPLAVWFAVRAYPTPDGLAVYYQDVTSRRELEARLLQAQKLEAVGQLAGGLAHDFNNLLAVINGYVSLAQLKLETDTPFVGMALAEIKGASERVTALTAKLLTFSRKEPLLSTVANLDEIVSASLDLVDPLIGRSITVHRMLHADCGNAVVDVAQIEQVIVNLAINARDAMHGAGNLYVTTGCVDLDASSVPELEPGRYLSLTVRDDGCGMDEKTRRQIFDPFFTTKPAGEGTGLGLSTAHGTIGQSGGRIDVASVPAEGTTFTIYLPRSDAPATAGRL